MPDLLDLSPDLGAVERMRGFDKLPADVRLALNEVPITVKKARFMRRIHGAGAAEFILTKYPRSA